MEVLGQSYSKSFIASLLLHTILFAFFLFSIETGYNANNTPSQPGEIVQAVVVDQQKVEEEIQKQQALEVQQKTAQEEQQRKMHEKLEQIKRANEQEQLKLEQIKHDLAKAKAEEEKRLSDIQIAKEQEQKQLEELKKENEKEKKRLAALDDQRQAEQERVKQMRLEREKEEKKKLAEKQKQEKTQELAKQEATKQEAAKTQAAQAAAKASKDAKEADRVAKEAQGRILSEAKRIGNEWKKKIQNNKREAYGLPSDLSCVVRVNVFPDGNVRVQIINSSGNTIYDDLAVKAVYKSQPFELPEDPKVRAELKETEFIIRNDESIG